MLSTPRWWFLKMTLSSKNDFPNEHTFSTVMFCSGNVCLDTHFSRSEYFKMKDITTTKAFRNCKVHYMHTLKFRSKPNTNVYCSMRFKGVTSRICGNSFIVCVQSLCVNVFQAKKAMIHQYITVISYKVIIYKNIHKSPPEGLIYGIYTHKSLCACSSTVKEIQLWFFY